MSDTIYYDVVHRSISIYLSIYIDYTEYKYRGR